ncbi:hypothetical protein AQULUS_09780 [Aquicella lusitana]|uniref:Uncharacterized protein n=1 Tax=Aquicella lusitana TaxID=254246 RepID=A0A370GYT8_9COXI|nr:hypothetical protein C8D86_10197 [Aquicella lusitana]VVC73246.1 hypothetical protein AQULUS_09780 [Aquicella lusitana]
MEVLFLMIIVEFIDNKEPIGYNLPQSLKTRIIKSEFNSGPGPRINCCSNDLSC